MHLIIDGINVFNYIYFLIMTEIWTSMHPDCPAPQYEMVQYGGNNTSYMTGGPIGGSSQPSRDEVLRDLHSRPPPAGAKPKQQSNFNNPKAKAKTLDQLAKEAVAAEKRKGLK